MPGTVAGLPIELAHLSWLVGQWKGEGRGEYPTVDPFIFGQHVSISCDGRPFLFYESRSWLLDAEGNVIRKSASEAGFFRPGPKNGVELLLSHPTGFTEVWHGDVVVTALEPDRVTGAKMKLRTDLVARTESAKPYTAGHRLYGMDGPDLLWTFDMAAMGEPLSNHLAARLHRVHASAAAG